MSSSLLMVSLATMVAAHNWINSPSRTSLDHSSASTVPPAIPAQSDEPHVVVRAGQPFPVEWVNGHGSDVIFTIVAASNFDKLLLINDKSTMAFFKDNTTCPQVPPPPKFMNYHQKYNDMTLDFDNVAGSDGIVPPPTPDFFKRRVPKTDPNYIPRNPMFKKSFKNLPNTNSTNLALISQFEYKDADTMNNRRCHPITPNAKMPWVIAMFRYRIVRHQPSRPDVALLDVPVGTPAGDYVVHYYWRGYMDAFDLRIVGGTADIAEPYGLPAPVGVAPVIRFKRFDHCNFPTMRSFGSCFPMTANDTTLPSPQQCIDLCKTQTFAKCDAVAVVPLKNPTAVPAIFRDIVNVRFNTNTCIKPTDPAVTHMCYTLVQNEPTQTENAFVLSEDTEDPAFYSTCFLRIDSFDRDGLPPANTRPLMQADKPKFRAGGRCVACDDRTTYTRASVTPVWQLANSCVNCDVPASSQ